MGVLIHFVMVKVRYRKIMILYPLLVAIFLKLMGENSSLELLMHFNLKALLQKTKKKIMILVKITMVYIIHERLTTSVIKLSVSV